MDTTTYTIDDQVDIVLHKIALAPNLSLTLNNLYDVAVMNESMYQLDHFMVEKGLLKAAGEGRVITAKGLEIVNFGGWISYKKQLKKDRPTNLFVPDLQQVKHTGEIAAMRREIDRYKLELQLKSEKETESSSIIKNLIEQNKTSRVVVFIGGIVLGLILSGILSYIIF